MKKANTEQTNLITLHKEHLGILEDQRDLYKDLLDKVIQKYVVQDEVGVSVSSFCSTCEDYTLVSIDGDIKCSVCGEEPKT